MVREVAHVRHRGSEEWRLDGLALGEEPVGDAVLVEGRDGPECKLAARSHQVRCRAALDGNHVHTN
ncbi:hypothetical protein BJ994_000542 [Arthrobacter pigmenti]|uniref:Uncharacterized protein n=1 Tax=Arthrobacter pigmenti TaxID=271432 RepID=A0A846RQU4_9MICC|nr:hypothetical protein [Arthrobacter pigmenti]NJC21466.1 hypothetical protein [Arthrobacter pigmenti]